MSVHTSSTTPLKGLAACRWLRRLAGVAVAATLVAGSALAIIEARWTRRFDAPYPAIAASEDPAVVARGEYLVYGAAACAYCHVPRERWVDLDRGDRLPLTGSHVFPLPFGQIYSANVTPDPATGIGRRSDGELARVLRFGVRADGRAAVPLMTFQLSDADIQAVISYLRSRPGVSHEVSEHRLTGFGKALMAFAIEPPAGAASAPAASPSGPTVERGEYLATRVSSCVECHTNRDDRGALTGPRFGGGQRMDVAADPTAVFVTPNLTPDPDTSPIGRWSEDIFVERFRLGEQTPGTPMPWGAFARLTDEDLRALYRYLRSLPPTRHDTGPSVQPSGVSRAE